MTRRVYIHHRVIAAIHIQILRQRVIKLPRYSVRGEEPARGRVVIPSPQEYEPAWIVRFAGEAEHVIHGFANGKRIAEGVVGVAVERCSVNVAYHRYAAQTVGMVEQHTSGTGAAI